jgi:aryl-alcohol dehydrogenase-like predicted oxidoreductase
VSNADPTQMREAAGITTLASAQNELSPRFRTSRPEVELCEQLGVTFLPWSPLGGMGSAAELARRHPHPRGQPARVGAGSVAAVDLVLTGDEIARLSSPAG